MAHPNYARFINVGKNFRLFFCNRKVDVKLLDVDFDKKRISLSMKALLNEDAE